MLIKVTQEHIDNGVRQDCMGCPIALACKDAGIKTPWVTETYVASCQFPSGEEKISLPLVAEEFVRNFDNEVEDAVAIKRVPFEFELDV